MKLLDKLKLTAKKLKTKILILYFAYQNPKLKLIPRILIVITIGYALSPVDLIPDFIPLLGLLDDLIILPILIALSIKLIPDDIMAESKRKAESEQINLRKNWIAGSLFIAIWIIVLGSIGYSIYSFIVNRG